MANQNGDLVGHMSYPIIKIIYSIRQVKTNDIISRRFGDLMMPLSGVQMRIKLTNVGSRVMTNLHSGGGYTDALARMESVCMFKLGVSLLILVYLSTTRVMLTTGTNGAY